MNPPHTNQRGPCRHEDKYPERRHLHACQAHHGFTLIELLVVLVIISVMAAFVGPRLAGSISNTDLRTASKRLAASLRYARSQAISQSRTFEAVFDLDKHRVVIRGGEKAGEEAEVGESRDEEKPPRASSYELPKNVRFEKVLWEGMEGDAGFFRMAFLASGASSGGEIILRNDRDRRCRVDVDVITGTVQVRSDASDD